ncbi:MAG: hypothetical protein ACJ8AT_30165 [Hyalangium sp.]|uniref:hypothetical protein n=1 Tax=Hyalangium sp. TaxID=2028555 RepID=UPI003899B865
MAESWLGLIRVRSSPCLNYQESHLLFDLERGGFQSPQELAANLKYGDFDKMLVIQTPSEKIEFPDDFATILLDNPQRQVSSGADAYSNAENRLKAAAVSGGITVSIDQHVCRSECICVQVYANHNQQKLDLFFD